MILMMIMWLYKLIIGCIIVIGSPFIIKRLWCFDCIVSWNSFSPSKVYMKKICRLLFVWHSFEDLFFGKSLCLSVHKYSKLQWSNWVDMNWHNELLATWVATVVAIANNTSTTIAFSRWPEFFSICKQHCSTYQNQQKECWKTLDKNHFPNTNRALLRRQSATTWHVTIYTSTYCIRYYCISIYFYKRWP